MRALTLREITSIIGMAVGILLLTVTGALAWQNSEPGIPGGLRNVGPPAHEGGLEPTVDATSAGARARS